MCLEFYTRIKSILKKKFFNPLFVEMKGSHFKKPFNRTFPKKYSAKICSFQISFKLPQCKFDFTESNYGYSFWECKLLFTLLQCFHNDVLLATHLKPAPALHFFLRFCEILASWYLTSCSFGCHGVSYERFCNIRMK